MSKTTFNGIHIDLGDISLIGQLGKDGGSWCAPVVWRNNGITIKLKMGDIIEQYAIIIGDKEKQEEAQAKANYERLVADWKACA